MANLEDTATELHRRNEKFDKIFKTYLDQRERNKELIEVFDDDMALLHQVQALNKRGGRSKRFGVVCICIKTQIS